MNTAEITQLLQGDPWTRDVFVGVYPRDKLPRTMKQYPGAYVCNTHPHTEEGEHWIVLYVDQHGQGEYFDSYGLPPVHKTFVNFLKNQCTSWTYNDKQLQGLTSHVCGQYCIFYLLHRCRGLSMPTIVHMFGPNVEDNDILVQDFIAQH